MPIIGGMVSQNVLNLVDTAMVGALGEASLAAVGMGGFANFMVTSFLTAGLAAAVQALAARLHGQKRHEETAAPLNVGLLLAVAVGVPLTIALFVSAPSLFPLLSDDGSVGAIGTPYFQARVIGLVGMAANYSFRGFWNATDRSQLYLRTLLLMHVSNIVLSYVLIFGPFGLPAYGATGAGIGTMISTYIGTASYVYLAFRHARREGFVRRRVDVSTVRSTLRLMAPAGLERFLAASGLTVMFWIIGVVGTEELAAATVLVNVFLVMLLPAIGFGLAAGALAGQALGRQDAADAQQWGLDVARMAAVLVAIIALPLTLFPDWVLGVFIHSAHTVELARAPLQLLAIGMPLETLGVVMMYGLIGAGATRRVLFISTSMQWLIYLPAAYLVGPVGGYGLIGIWTVREAYRLVQSSVFFSSWTRQRLAAIRV